MKDQLAEGVEIAPGETVKGQRTNRKETTPKYGVYRWSAVAIQKDGTRLYKREFVELPEWAELSLAAKIVKLPIKRDTLRRLVIADFVEHTRPSPRTILISIDSLLKHIETVRKNPEFWHDPLNAIRWIESRNALYNIGKADLEAAKKSRLKGKGSEIASERRQGKRLS